MSQWSPCKRKDFIHKLRKLGFDGPFVGTRHHFMVYEEHRLTIPSNHEYSISQLRMMLQETESVLARRITVEEWSSL
ncbi:hypothetical protein AUJ95_08970 [Candidatus Desantisbacteria bacterium CG2_30_40_21]|uniref:Type II toxin-antitoxin system HicA family toxin n=1 Tax=Candidatus Desantisbacteria bacterium CG2_30_40_21 TaxID=1817895 RepID=A0A1J5DKS7_9BACT|nr:MAG: hypothetical protein AUJ95_08970 [Candidatus Desantisbacteria bacterium CG2_30_40_21]